MRTLALFVVSLIMVAGATTTSADPVVPSANSVVCSKCGKVHYVCPKCGKVHALAHHVTESTVGLTATPVITQATTTSVTPSPNVAPTPTVIQSTPVRAMSFESPMAPSSAIRAVAGVTNVLANLNAQRARQGIRILRYDPQLQVVAQRRAQVMASRGLKNHPPGSFSPGRYEGVGWSSSYSPSGVSACYTSDPRMTYAGAAMVTGRDGVYFAVVYR